MFIERGNNNFNEVWRWLVGFFVIFLGCQLLGGIPFLIALVAGAIQRDEIELFLNSMNDQSFLMNYLSHNTTFFYLMITFVIGTVVWWLWIKYVHKLTWAQATTSRATFDWKRAFLAFGIVGAVSLIGTYVGYQMVPEDYVWNYQADKFWILVILAFTLVPIQTTWEELFFRSYMMQGLGLMSGNRAVPFIVTSVVFGLMHAFNPEVAKMGYIILIWYVGTGFLLGLFTLMDEGTELAIGFHAANNLFIALLVTSDWTVFQTDSLLRDIADPEVGFVTFIPLLVFYPLLIVLFAKVYKWTDWKEKLFGKVLTKEEFENLNA